MNNHLEKIIQSCEKDLEHNGCNCFIHALKVYMEREVDGAKELDQCKLRELIETLYEDPIDTKKEIK